jgi:glycosyltransferase involved in cell wall biosynthesis
MTQQNTEIPSQVVGLFDGDTDPRPVMVSIRCITYNHEPYIRQTLEGFVMQKTNFRFEAIVHDDASTDGTAAIIREYAEKYPDIIIPIYETENQYSKRDGSLGRIMNAAVRGQYIAYCEGDDYWTDPYKLQKQVDFLEAHPEYSFCFHQTKKYFQNENRWEYLIPLPFETDIELTESIFFSGRWLTQMLSLMITADLHQKLYACSMNYKHWNDNAIIYHMLKFARGVVLHECMGVYRKHNGGVSSNATKENAVAFATYNLYLYNEMLMHNPTDQKVRDRCYGQAVLVYSLQKLLNRDVLKILYHTCPSKKVLLHDLIGYKMPKAYFKLKDCIKNSLQRL